MCVKVTPEGEEVTAKIGTGTVSEEVVGIVIVMAVTVEIGIVVEVDGIVVIRTIETVGAVIETVVAAGTGTVEAAVISAEAVTIETAVVVIVVIVNAAVRTETLVPVFISHKITVYTFLP